MSSRHSLSYQSWFMLFAVSLLAFLRSIDYTSVNLALLPISEEIDSNLNILQWLLSGYILTWGALVILGGRLADLYGKKNILIMGVVIFMLGSIVMGEGYTIEALIFGRILQGVGAALFSAPGHGLIFISVPVNKQGMAMGVMGSAAGLGLALGPTLAGWLINTMSWRWIFYINIPLGIIIITILMLYAPREKSSETAKINWLTAGLLAFGLGSIVFALNQIEVWGVRDGRLWGMVCAGVSAIALFRYLDRCQTSQMIPQALVRNKPFMGALANGFLISYSFALTIVMMGLYLQNTLRLSSFQTGEMFLVMTLVLGVLSIVGGKLVDRMDIRIPTAGGPIFLALAFFVMMFFDAQSTVWMVGSGLLLAGLGLGICIPSMNTAVLRTAPSDKINIGSALFTMAMLLANSLSVILSTSLMVMEGRSHLMTLITREGYVLTPQEVGILANTIAKVDHTAAQLQGLPQDKISMCLELIDQAFLYGFRITLAIGIVCAILAVWVSSRYFRSVARPYARATTATTIVT